LKTYHLFTEAIRCGEIANIALRSFRKHHGDLIVTVYGTQKDFSEIQTKEGIEFVDIETKPWGRQVLDRFLQGGHWGTATLWAHLIQERPETMLCHFDSDIIFFEDLMREVLGYSEEFDLVGPRRNYHDNKAYPTGLVGVPPVTATSTFSFNRFKVDLAAWDFETLVNKVRGMDTSGLNHRTIDFFDPVAFSLLYSGATIKFLNWNDVGGCDEHGSRQNDYATLNDGDVPFKIEYGKKMAHFSAVGSGKNFFDNPVARSNVPKSYVDYSLDRYAIFCKVFYNRDIGIEVSKYQYLLDPSVWEKAL